MSPLERVLTACRGLESIVYHRIWPSVDPTYRLLPSGRASIQCLSILFMSVALTVPYSARDADLGLLG